MGKVAPVVLLSLHVAQAAGFVPCPTAVGAHATNPPWAGRMPAGRGARVAAPGYELRLPSSAHAGGALCRGAALSCEAAQRRAVAPLTDVPLGSAALSRGAAWLRRALRALLSVKVLFLASLLGFCLCVAVTPSLAGASPNDPSGSTVAEAPAHEDGAPAGSKTMKIVTVVSGGGLAVHTLMSHWQCKEKSRRWGHQ
jgi:hypothetical protein